MYKLAVKTCNKVKYLAEGQKTKKTTKTFLQTVAHSKLVTCLMFMYIPTYTHTYTNSYIYTYTKTFTTYAP